MCEYCFPPDHSLFRSLCSYESRCTPVCPSLVMTVQHVTKLYTQVDISNWLECCQNLTTQCQTSNWHCHMNSTEQHNIHVELGTQWKQKFTCVSVETEVYMRKQAPGKEVGTCTLSKNYLQKSRLKLIWGQKITIFCFLTSKHFKSIINAKPLCWTQT